MEQLLEILNKVKPNVNFIEEKNLFESCILDSMNIIMIASEINDEFDIEIKVTDITPENFNSVNSMMKMINRLQEEDD